MPGKRRTRRDDETPELDEVEAQPEANPPEPVTGREPEAALPEEAVIERASSHLADALDTPDSDPAEVYHRRARLAEDRLEEVLGAYRRLKLETEQHRERVGRNIERRFMERREQLVLRFIDILDNLDRALEASERSYATESLVDGLIMVRSLLLQTLRDEGLERIPVLGLPFDPETSEAVETRPVEAADHHHLVVGEMLRGYRFEGRLVRPARVVVGEFAQPEQTPAAPPVSPAATGANGDDDEVEVDTESSVEDMDDEEPPSS